MLTARDEIIEALRHFTGPILQKPPAYSAIKVAGKRAYKLAREGAPVDLPPREVEILELTLTDMPSEHLASFEAVCSKGTYIRTLARDLAEKLDTYGHVARLRRTRVGPFCESDISPRK